MAVQRSPKASYGGSIPSHPASLRNRGATGQRRSFLKTRLWVRVPPVPPLREAPPVESLPERHGINLAPIYGKVVQAKKHQQHELEICRMGHGTAER